MASRSVFVNVIVLALVTLLLAAGIDRLNLVGKTAYAVESGKLDASYDHLSKIMPTDLEPLAQLSRGFALISETSKQSVVFIDALTNAKLDDRVKQLLEESDVPIPPSRGTGSGVIFDAAGYIVTNNHVVAGSDKVRVTLSDGRKHDAVVVGTDAKTDLAVVRINANNLMPARFGDSDDVRVGHLVLAIGSPFRLGHSVTHGIISAIGRFNVDVNIDYQDWLQTDAAINPGNSGGPLINTQGEVIGLNTAIATESGANQGVAFAIPSNTIKRIVEKLKTGREIVRGYLGVSIEPVNPQIASAYDYDRAYGVLIQAVGKDTPAMRAGLQPEDIVMRIDNRVVRNREKMQHMIAAIEPGAIAELVVWRKGIELVLPTRIGAQPGNFRTTGRLGDIAPAPSPAGQPNTQTSRNQIPKMQELNEGRRSTNSLRPDNSTGPRRVFRNIGLEASTVTPELSKRYRLPDDIINGVVITRVYPTGSSYLADLRPGYVIISANDGPIQNIAEFESLLTTENLRKGIRLKLRIRNGGSYQDWFTVLSSR